MTITNRKYIIFIILLIIIGAGFFLYYQKISKKNNIYHIVVTQKTSLQEPKNTFLIEILENIFGLPKKSISDIVYDTREGSPHNENSSPLNFTYYILVKGEPVKLKLKYENENVIIKTKIANEKLIPYITDPNYCAINSDCVIRDNFCSYGSFNHYHIFYDVWGCAASTATEFECDTANPPDECDSSNCTQEVKYEGAKCVKNKCVAEKKIGDCVPW